MRTDYTKASTSYLCMVLTLDGTSFETIACQALALDELKRREARVG